MEEVKSLERIAFLSVYQHITSSLAAKEGPPAKKKRKLGLLSSGAAARSGKWSVSVDPIAIIKKKLDENLVGGFSRYREALWKWYNRQSPTTRPAVDTFLACVLDSNFTSLKLGVNHIFSGRPPCLGPNKCDVFLLMSLPKFGNLVEMRISCPILADFSLAFFTELGTSCPKIKMLKLGSRSNPFQFFAEQQLALVLGGRKSLLPSSLIEKFKRGDYSHIYFDSKTPICNSLEVFSIWSKSTRGGGAAVTNAYKMSITTNVFMLRHFGNITQSAVGFDNIIFKKAMPEAVKELFYDPMFRLISKEREATGVVNDQEMSVKWTRFYNKKTPCKTLNLTVLKASTIDLRDHEMVNAVISMCPQLMEICFYGNYDEGTESLRRLLSDQLTEVRSLTFQSVDYEEREAILASLGHQLQQVKFIDCYDIDLEVELQPCIVMELLKLDYIAIEDLFESNTNMPYEIMSRIKKLEVQLDDENLEEFLIFVASLKSEHLTSLSINFECAVGNPFSNILWEELALNWPEIEDLTVYSRVYRGSDIYDLFIQVRKCIPQLTKLKSITLPCNAWFSGYLNEKEMCCQIDAYLKRKFPNRPNPIEVKFEKMPPRERRFLAEMF